MNAVLHRTAHTKGWMSGTAEVRALDEVYVGTQRARFTAVVGPSGSGESTLMRCAAGLREDGCRWCALVVADAQVCGDRADEAERQADGGGDPGRAPPESVLGDPVFAVRRGRSVIPACFRAGSRRWIPKHAGETVRP